MAYKRKTYDEWEIQGDYGQGYERVTTEATRMEALSQLRCYQTNEPMYSFRIKKKRVKIQ